MLSLALLIATQAAVVDAGTEPMAAGDAGPAAVVAVVADAPAVEPPFSLTLLGTEQAILVVTDAWTSDIGTLKRFEKVGPKWMQLGPSIEIVVGEAGLGWGLGLHPLGVGEPRKTEGDGRGVAGVFAIASAFGRGEPLTKTKMPWLETNATMQCIDDPRSARYNRIIVDAPDAPRDYKSTEPMQRDDGLYDVGLLVDHNAFGDGHKQVIPGRGSCVFVHTWRRKGQSTNGCTAMSRVDLEKIVEWLEPAKHPVLIQLPKEEWVKRRFPWGLP